MHNDHPQDLRLVQVAATADGLRALQRPKNHDGAKDVEHQWDDKAHRFYKHHHFGQLGLPLLVGVVLKAVDGGGVDIFG